jgi:hypothetical protein
MAMLKKYIGQKLCRKDSGTIIEITIIIIVENRIKMGRKSFMVK